MEIVLAPARPGEKIVINNFDETSIVAEYRDFSTNKVMWAQRLPLAHIFAENTNAAE
jgi:hypothetical protein